MSAEARHIEEVMKENELFVSLEVIKERILTFFDCRDEKEAQQVFTVAQLVFDIRKYLTVP